MRNQLARKFGGLNRAHIHHQRLPVLCQGGPVGRFGVDFAVAGDEHRAVRVVAVGERDAGVGGRAQCGGDAGHHFKRNARFAQGFQFLAAAPEHERVAALEPHHAFARTGMAHQQEVGFLLRHAAAAGALAHADFVGIAPHQIQHRIRHQRVVQHHVGFLNALQAFEREQPGIARPRAHQRHFAALRLLPGQMPPHQLPGLAAAAAFRQTPEGGGSKQPFPEAAALRRAAEPRLHAAAPLPGNLRHYAQTLR